MIKKLKIVLLWNFLFFISLSVANDLLEEIVEGIKYHNSLIKDWKAICEITVRMDDGKVVKEEEVWAQKGEKLYREKRNEDGEISYIVSFDGEVLRITGDNKKGLIKIPTESDLRRAFLNPVHSPLSLFKIVRLENKPIYSFLIEKEKNKTLEPIKKTKVDKEECYLIKSTVQKEGGIFRYTFYISPYYGFYPLKISIETENKYGYTESQINNTYRKFGNIWFLERSEIRNSLNFEKYNKDYEGSTEYKVELKNIEINKEIPDSFFQIKFPSGTKVWDERTGISYIVK